MRSRIQVYALTDDGRVWGWGVNTSRKLTDTSTSAPIPDPVVSSDGVPRVVDIAAGLNHVLFLDQHGDVYARGDNLFGSKGHPTQGRFPLVARVAGLPPIASIAAGGNTSFAVDWQGRVWSWGSNAQGMLGRGTFGQADHRPGLVSLQGPVRKVYAAYNGLSAFTIALGPTELPGTDGAHASATVRAWGSNHYRTLSTSAVPAGNLNASGASRSPLVVETLSGAQHLARHLAPAQDFVVSMSAFGQISFWGFGPSAPPWPASLR